MYCGAPSAAGEALLDGMFAQMEVMRKQDERIGEQPVLNFVLHRTPGLRWRVLPRDEYPNGASYFVRRKWPAALPVIVHNNWLAGYKKKRARFERHGMWLLGPGDAPQLQAERVKQQWHAGRSGTKLSDGSPAKPSGYAKREVESARRKPVQRVLAPGWEQQTDEESGEIYFYNEESGETTYEPPVANKGRRAKKMAAPDSLARVGMLAADMRRELMRQETAPQALGERRTEAAVSLYCAAYEAGRACWRTSIEAETSRCRSGVRSCQSGT